MEDRNTCAICGATCQDAASIGGHAICQVCRRLLDDPVNRVLTEPEREPAQPVSIHIKR